MTDAVRTLLVACTALAIAMIRLSVIAMKADPASPARLIAELRLAQFSAFLLVLTAGVYVGFALAQTSTTGSGLDVALGVGFLLLASVAVTQAPGRALTLLAVAFVAHAVIDLCHAAGILPAEALRSNSSACVRVTPFISTTIFLIFLPLDLLNSVKYSQCKNPLVITVAQKLSGLATV